MLVDSQSLLEQSCGPLVAASWCAMDVEFVRRTTYFPKVSLIQAALPKGTPALIDVLAVDNLDPVKELLVQEACLKVFHASSQDLEALQIAAGAIPQPLFDTQVAAAFCGLGYQISFATLVESCLGIHISKGQQQSNWMKRPLEHRQIVYAERDVSYLADAYLVLQQRLAENGRGQWVLSSCQELIDEFSRDPDQGRDRAARIPGWGRLKPQRYTLLAALAEWRDNLAREKNRPPRWILPDAAMMAVASAAPENDRQLERITELEPKERAKLGQDLLRCVQEVLALPSEKWRLPPKNDPPTPQEKRLAKQLTECIATIAEASGVAATVIATQKQIGHLVRCRDYDENPLCTGWRRELLGDALLKILEPS